MKPILIYPVLTSLALATLAAPAGGMPAAKAPAPPLPAPAANPLSFFGGKLVLDIEEIVRYESRENNFDFNNNGDALTDDSQLLQRVRLGALFAPVSFFKILRPGPGRLRIFLGPP